MKVTDIAHEIYTELGSPSDLSIPATAYWIRSNVGALNNLINTAFTENSTTFEVEQAVTEDDGTSTIVEIKQEEAAVLKKMHLVHYYGVQVRGSIGAAAWDSVIEVSDMQTKVKKINRSEIGKTFAQILKEEQAQLKVLVTAYKDSEVKPLQVAGDDTIGNDTSSTGSAFSRVSGNTN